MTRALLLGGLALAVSAVACSAGAGRVQPVPVAASPWAMFRGGPSHEGDFEDRATPRWRVRWTVELGERVDASAVITGDGSVIVATRAGSVVALDLATGAERKRVRLPGGIWSSPALAGSVLVVAAKDGHVYGLDARTLQSRWKTAVPSPWLSGITSAGGVAYLSSGAVLLALDPATGAVHWQRPTGARIARAVAVDVDADLIVGGNRAGQVLAFHLDGRARWDAATSPGAHNDGPATISAGMVLVGSNDRALHAFDGATGAPLWTSPTRNWVVSSAAVSDRRVYTGDDGGRLRCLDLADGRVIWAAKAGDDVASSPTVVGDWVIHGAHDGKLWARDKHTGVPRVPINLGAAAFASPAVAADGAIVIATHAGRVIAVD